MDVILKGIGLGIGVIIGLILIILVVGLVVAGVVYLYKLYLKKKFSPELFIKYKNELLKQQRFEELEKVTQIINRLEKKEKPKELLADYAITVDSYFYWRSTWDGGERLTYRHDRQIIKKKIIKKKSARKRK